MMYLCLISKYTYVREFITTAEPHKLPYADVKRTPVYNTGGPFRGRTLEKKKMVFI